MRPHRIYIVEYRGEATEYVPGRLGSARRRERVTAASPTEAIIRVQRRCGGTDHRIAGRML